MPKQIEDLVDHYWGAINYIASLIKASEIKAGLILSFYGIALGFIIDSIGTVYETIESNTVFSVLSMIWFVLVGASIFFSVRCFMPRLETQFDENVFFFKDIISKYGDIHSYSQKLYEVSTEEEELFRQLGHQIYINSKIASLKFENVKRSLYCLAWSFAVIMVFLIYYFFFQ
ncbi:MAG: hypothetical protein KTR13_08305 [Saprospiraceae bacterium]|nr:hypothetical protein [Saprospiraceae bacterium]